LDSFRQTLEEKINLRVPIRNEELDTEVEKFLVDIQQSTWGNTLEIERRAKGNNYSKEIRDLIAEKRKARRRWHQTRDPQDKTVLNNPAQQLKSYIKELKNNTISAYLREMTYDNNTDHSLWKTTKKINRPVMQIPPIRKTDGKWARNNEQKAQRFAEHMEYIFQLQGKQEQKEMITEDIVQENEEIKLVTATEIKNEINKQHHKT